MFRLLAVVVSTFSVTAVRRSLSLQVKGLKVRGGETVIHPTDYDSFAGAISPGNSKLVVVDFSASWCGPCRMIAPAFAALAHQMKPDVVFVKVDVDEVPEASQAYSISSLPTFILFRDGAEIFRFSGASIEKLRLALADAGAIVPSNDIF